MEEDSTHVEAEKYPSLGCRTSRDSHLPNKLAFHFFQLADQVRLLHLNVSSAAPHWSGIREIPRSSQTTRLGLAMNVTGRAHAFLLLPFGNCGLGYSILVIRDADPDSDQVTFALGRRYDLLRGVGRHSLNCGEELPLVGVLVEV